MKNLRVLTMIRKEKLTENGNREAGEGMGVGMSMNKSMEVVVSMGVDQVVEVGVGIDKDVEVRVSMDKVVEVGVWVDVGACVWSRSWRWECE